MVGIKDIAKVANVSISTVSYALNGSSKVTEKTRAKIVKIAEELNYIPNRAGRNLRKKETQIIGVYLATYGGTFYGDLLEGIMSTAKENNYDMIVCSGDRSRLFLPERMIDGAIILDTGFPDEELIDYADRGHKIVVMDRKIEHENIRRVLVDNRHGAKMAIEELVKNPDSLVYLITGPPDSFDNHERLEAAIEKLSESNQPYEIIEGDFSEVSGQRIGKIIHNKWTEKVSVFSFNDEMAIGIYNYFKKTNLKIGKDIRLIGFDNLLVSKYMIPRLASIAYSKHKWGSIAAQSLINLIKDESVENQVLKTTLVKSQSY
ncbi:transcriptional regulator [Carnobacterium sp. 17-4]|uniref:LacI family DNA-binding transcriptional regulator n=1 Tax=Carnobacterium sp. (strain 17-4) TaxID=208596 RepID=UPI0002058B10|nr:LacI family DNA-binding transcriptional regulator [Carnobacterium sp. 17-4]AEB30117.1 transcriptional regulator [Carnobacterium sp. 17-4]